MNSNRMYEVNDSSFILELLGDGSVVIWDTSLEEAFAEWVRQGKPPTSRPPSPIAASGLSEEEAFDWLMKALRKDHPYIPVTTL